MEQELSGVGLEMGLCQSCGMPLAAEEHFGTNADNTPSGEYCCFCYREGRYTDGFSLPEKIAECVAYHDETEKENGRTLTRNELSVRMHLLLPRLRRWSSHENCHVHYYEAVNRAVNYIHGNLSSRLDLKMLAGAACVSEYHFHRIFRAVMGEAPGAYIQLLRLEKAAFMLRGNDMPIAETAAVCGYESQQAFSRAFRQRYGISPARFRRSPVEVKFPVDESANLGIEPDIRHRGTFEVAGLRVINPLGNRYAFTDAWNKLTRITGKYLFADPSREYLLFNRDCSTITRPEHYNIYACVSPPVLSRRFTRFGVEGGRFAVFTYTGPYAGLGKVYCHIYRWWLPYGDYELRDSISFEKFLNSPSAKGIYEPVTEVWIPVK